MSEVSNLWPVGRIHSARQANLHFENIFNILLIANNNSYKSLILLPLHLNLKHFRP